MPSREMSEVKKVGQLFDQLCQGITASVGALKLAPPVSLHFNTVVDVLDLFWRFFLW